LELNRCFLPILAISLLSVSFPQKSDGFWIKSEEDLNKLNPPERKVARKLVSLGLRVSYEQTQIMVDEGVVVKVHKNGKNKRKNLTTPDFRVELDNIVCFIEVGSHKSGPHKKRQQKIAELASKSKGDFKFIYIQLFKKDIDELEEVDSLSDLLIFLQNRAVFVNNF